MNKDFHLKAKARFLRQESGLDCLLCAMFARQRQDGSLQTPIPPRKLGSDPCPRRARVEDAHTFAPRNSRLESNKEEEEMSRKARFERIHPGSGGGKGGGGGVSSF